MKRVPEQQDQVSKVEKLMLGPIAQVATTTKMSGTRLKDLPEAFYRLHWTTEILEDR